MNLEGKLCPCGDGYTCEADRCVRATDTNGVPSCPDPPAPTAHGLSCGRSHTCRIRDGELWCWGDNSTGALGQGHQDPVDTPTRVGTETDWTWISGGAGHTCGIRNRDGFGALFCWGSNDTGQLGLGDDVTRLVPVQVTQNVSFAQIATGESHTCGLEDDGTLWCWGRQEGGAVGLGVIGPPLSVPARVSEVDHYASIVAGAGHNCAVRDSGSLWCWGHFECMQTGSVDHQLAPAQVGEACWATAAVGMQHSCGLSPEGQALCFGSNEVAQLGLGFVAGGEAAPFDGCNAFLTPQRVSGPETWSTLASGWMHGCGIGSNGSLWCWGFNEQRQVADTSTNPEPAPVEISSATDWVDVCTGFFHTCALNAQDEIWCVGDNGRGEQGTGEANATLTLVPFPDSG